MFGKSFIREGWWYCMIKAILILYAMQIYFTDQPELPRTLLRFVILK